MKTPRNRAFALLLVLIAIVLSTSMAVFFLTSAGRERRGVSLYATSSEVRHLAGTTVSRVMGQINAATKEGTAAAPVSWASQPGMIRTFVGGGDAQNIYKLYSWDTALSSSGTGFNPTATAQVPPAGWQNIKAEYVDLNQPINGVYPILDPGAAGLVEGFSIDASNAAVAGSGSAAPMPVRWLYVLEDGQMVAASNGSGSTASVTGASAANPIIGRVAFWTDDETSKVNINTASEGAYWDWPKAATRDELQFAGNPPVGGEFNRTPGHPAMTSLSAVLSEMAPGDRWTDVAGYRSKLTAILNLTPRVPSSNVSSRGGTYPIESKTFAFGPKGTLPSIPNTPLSLKTDRLYVSPEEMLFQHPTRSPQIGVSANMIRERSFFLTSSSRAPETTLFETPRISLWPVTWPWTSAHAATNRVLNPSSPAPDSSTIASNLWMKAEERLLAFTSILNRQRSDGGDRYFFQRQNPESPTHDYSQIARNRQLLTYLQRLTDTSVPGFGGTLEAKYPGIETEALLSNTFNGIRSLVNQYTLDTDGRMLYSYVPVSFSHFKNKSGVVVQDYSESGAFSPIPLKLNLGSGEIVTLSEFPVLREVALSFIATDREPPRPPTTFPPSVVTAEEKRAFYRNPNNWQNLINVGTGDPSAPVGYPRGAQTKRMQAMMILDFSPVAGALASNEPVFWVKITGSSPSVNGADLGFGNAVAKMDFRTGGGSPRAIPAFMQPLYKKDATGAIAGSKDLINGDINNNNYGLISVPITVQPSDTTFQFAGGDYTIDIYGLLNGNPDVDPTNNPSLLIASYKADFASWASAPLPMPLAPFWNYFEIDFTEDPLTAAPLGLNYIPPPNPNFQAYDPAGGNTRWSVVEIAPIYRGAESTGDPAVTTNPSTIWSFTSLYTTVSKGNGGTGMFTKPGANLYGYSVAYALRHRTEPSFMTSFKNRLDFTGNEKSAGPIANDLVGASRRASLVPLFKSNAFPFTTPYDTVISVIPDPVKRGNGDPRLAQRFEFSSSKDIMTPGNVPIRENLPRVGGLAPNDYNFPNLQYHSLGSGEQFTVATGYIVRGLYSVLGATIAPEGMAQGGRFTKGVGGDLGTESGDETYVGVTSARPAHTIANSKSVGDWTSLPGYRSDGGSLSRPDQDFQALTNQTPGGNGLTYQVPFFRQSASGSLRLSTTAASGYFSPNRQIPSPITLLGSLPTSRSIGWQTLVFSPNPAIDTGNFSLPTHPGLNNLKDHVILDLFWMPVAEPYPISEEFSTAGKVNLNYRIAPFNYITRRTALHAALNSTWITALRNVLSKNYKSFISTVTNHTDTVAKSRYKINIEETLDRVDTDIFNTGDIFRSASQICETWLVPEGSTANAVETFWDDKLLTSDTAREAPYDHLYSRVTTKSNTFTVHWRAQILKKIPGTAVAVWDESKDRVMSELRGSTLIERFIDPNATDIPDYATDTTALPLTNFYKWRVVSENYFQP